MRFQTTLPAGLLRVLASAFLVGVGFSLVSLLLNFHLEGIGFDRRLIGYANSVGALSVVVFGLPAGVLVPRLGYARSLRLAAVLSAAGLGLAAVGAAPLPVFAGLLCFGLGQSFVIGAAAPLISALVPPERRVGALSLQAALSTGAGFLGNLGGGLLPSLLGGTGPAMLAAALVFAAAGAPLLGLAGGAEGMTSRRLRVSRPGVWARLLGPPVVVGLGAGLTIPFLNLYVRQKFGLEPGTVGVLFAVSSLATMAAILLQPALVRRLGKVGAIVAVQGASLPFILALAYAPSLPVVTVALFVRGALMQAAGPVYQALAVDLLPEDERPGLLLAEGALWSGGFALSSSVSGALQAARGPAAFDLLFAGMLGFYVVGTLMYVAFFGLGRKRGRVTAVASQ